MIFKPSREVYDSIKLLSKFRSVLNLVQGELPPRKLPPDELPPIKSPPGKFPPDEFPPGRLPPICLPWILLWTIAPSKIIAKRKQIT